MEIHFVTHYQDLQKEEFEFINQQMIPLTEYSPLQLIDLMFRSVNLYHPKSKLTLLTTKESSVEGLDKKIEIIRYPFDHYGNRLSEMASIHSFLSEYREGAHLIFLDFDTLVQESLDEIFKKKFDIFFIRHHFEFKKQPPINMGVFGVQQGRAQRAAYLFKRMIDQILPFQELHFWGGSQLALQKLLFHQLYSQPPSRYIMYRDIVIYLLPIDYNFTPDEQSMNRFYPGKKIIHFWGERKKDMPKYWKDYLSPNRIK